MKYSIVMISVIIPCYNCQNYILRSVNSVMNQTLKPCEIILVDNNSSDGTLMILLKLEKEYPNLIKVFEEHKPGAPAARNKGLVLAKGRYIQFLDADDELKPPKLQLQYQQAKSNNADVIIGSRILQYAINGQIKQHVRFPDNDIWRGLITSNLGITSSNLWKKDAVMRAGAWDVDLSSSQEYNLMFRLLQLHANFEIDNAVQTIIHKSNSAISKSTDHHKLEAIVLNRIALRKMIISYLREQGLLTPVLIKAADDYMYEELMRSFNSIPQFVNKYLSSNKLQPSKNLVAKYYLKRILNKTTY